MKYFIFIFSVLFTSQAVAIDPLSAVPESAKEVLATIVTDMGIPENDNRTAIVKLYENNSQLLNDQWFAYWTSFKSMSAYKGKQGNSVELVLNTDNAGIAILTYSYDPTSRQILINAKQIRYGSSKAALDVYESEKKDGYEVVSENKSRATLKKNGTKVYTLINISAPNAGVVYNETTILSLD